MKNGNFCTKNYIIGPSTLIKENIIIGFGGNSFHGAISSAGKNFERIYSYFDFTTKRLMHRVNDVKLTPDYQAGGKVPYVRIGNCNIDTNFRLLKE